MPMCSPRPVHASNETCVFVLNISLDSPVRRGATARSWRCCVQRTSRAGPAGWPPSDCSKYAARSLAPLDVEETFSETKTRWRWRRLPSLVSPPPQFGIVLYQSYNVPQQRKSSLSPFSAPVVRIWHHALNAPPPPRLLPLSPKLNPDWSINWLTLNWKPVGSLASLCLRPDQVLRSIRRISRV